jgi:hypothetical protein
MVNLLATGVEWLDGTRQTHLAELVTYERGVESVQTWATLGSTDYEIADDVGAVVEAKTTDFIVTAASLILGGNAKKPQIGDQIRVTRDATILIFEVLDLGGSGHYRPLDPYGEMLRIHTKQIDTEDA